MSAVYKEGRVELRPNNNCATEWAEEEWMNDWLTNEIGPGRVVLARAFIIIYYREEMLQILFVPWLIDLTWLMIDWLIDVVEHWDYAFNVWGRRQWGWGGMDAVLPPVMVALRSSPPCRRFGNRWLCLIALLDYINDVVLARAKITNPCESNVKRGSQDHLPS